jgi:hypothetical protein
MIDLTGWGRSRRALSASALLLPCMLMAVLSFFSTAVAQVQDLDQIWGPKRQFQRMRRKRPLSADPSGQLRVQTFKVRQDGEPQPNATPNCPDPEVTYFGGPVISNAQIVVVYWNSNVNSAAQAALPTFFEGITNSTFYDELSEYSTNIASAPDMGQTNQSIGRGSYVGAYTIVPSVCPATTTTACDVTDAQIQTELTNQIASTALPSPVYDSNGFDNTLYMVNFPGNVSINDDDSYSCTDWCGYHSTGGTTSNPIVYSVIPDYFTGACSGTACGNATELENLTDTLSHEMAESVTDTEIGFDTDTSVYYAYPDAWGDNNAGDYYCGEIADNCDDFTGTIVPTPTGNYNINELWSNKLNECVSAAGSHPGFQLSQPSTAVSATPFNFTLTALNPSGGLGTDISFVGTVNFTSSDTAGGVILPANFTFTPSDQGTASFSATLQTGGAQSITATDTVNSAITATASTTVTTTNQVKVTVGTSPAGLSFSIDGTAYSSAQTPTWTIGSSHTIATTSPQNPVAGTEDTFTSWSDGGALSHAVTASASTTSYTALFSTQYLLTTAVSPSAGGTVSPATGYQTAASSVSLVASAATGYAFVNWTSSPGTVASPTSASTSITMSAPESATANFALTGPTITSISPTSKTVGGVKFTLTVKGTNYVSGATINWNGTALVTKFVNSGELTTSVPATDITAAGTAPITVSNPSSGGTSNSATFIIDNPKPVITSLSPATAIVKGAGFTLTVNGREFINGAVVNWAGSARSTVFVSATEVTATINAADVVKAGKFKITVTNSAPGGGNSAPATFDVDNPAPTLTDISPNSATHGGAAFTLTATGTNFVSTSKIQWNGVDLAIKFVSSTTLTAVISKTDIADAGTADVTVDTPTPGGGITAAQMFTIN